MWAVPLVGGTGEKGLDLQDVYWLILWTLEAGRWVMSKIVFPDNNSAFPRTLPFSFPLITDMASEMWAVQCRGWLGYKDVANKRQQEMPSVWCSISVIPQQREINRRWSFPPVSCGWRTLTLSSFSSRLSGKLQWGCTSLLGKTLPLLRPSAHMATCFSLPAQSLWHLHFHWMEICLCCSPVK